MAGITMTTKWENKVRRYMNKSSHALLASNPSQISNLIEKSKHMVFLAKNYIF